MYPGNSELDIDLESHREPQESDDMHLVEVLLKSWRHNLAILISEPRGAESNRPPEYTYVDKVIRGCMGTVSP